MRDDYGDVGVPAYVVVGLERAGQNNGFRPAQLGQVCDEMLVEWRFHPDGEDLVWSCDARIPLSSGGRARLPLTGRIRNVRTHTGKSLANTATVVRYLFEEGERERDWRRIGWHLAHRRRGIDNRAENECPGGPGWHQICLESTLAPTRCGGQGMNLSILL